MKDLKGITTIELLEELEKRKSKKLSRSNKERGWYPKLSFNADCGEVTINGYSINGIKELKLEVKGGEKYSAVTMIFDAEVEFKGSVIALPHFSYTSYSEKEINAVKKALEGIK